MTKYIKPPRSEDCEWRSGPPPEIGWWPASVMCNPDRLRFWNGEYWSTDVASTEDAATAAGFGEIRALGFPSVYWTDRWWLK